MDLPQLGAREERALLRGERGAARQERELLVAAPDVMWDQHRSLDL